MVYASSANSINRLLHAGLANTSAPTSQVHRDPLTEQAVADADGRGDRPDQRVSGAHRVIAGAERGQESCVGLQSRAVCGD